MRSSGSQQGTTPREKKCCCRKRPRRWCVSHFLAKFGVEKFIKRGRP